MLDLLDLRSQIGLPLTAFHIVEQEPEQPYQRILKEEEDAQLVHEAEAFICHRVLRLERLRDLEI